MKRNLFALVIALSFVPLGAQEAPPKFELAVPGYTFEFPRDHGAHDEYALEWWYYTGHLSASDGRRYGFELTFFRVGVAPPSQRETAWDLHNLYPAHFAISDLNANEFRFHQKLNRSSDYIANARAGSLGVFNEGWSATTLADGSMRIRASADGDAIDLVLRSQKPPAIHGVGGVSVKGEGAGDATHYYSLTRLAVTGSVTRNGVAKRCDGLAWMDHEFGSSTLRHEQTGWDWISLQLDNESELMLYQMRRRDGSIDPASSGSIVMPDGSVVHLDHKSFSITPTGKWKSPGSGAVYPMGWIVEVPSLGVRVRIREEMKDQELVTRSTTGVVYWEGAVKTSGTFGETPVSGVGYVEMTGYGK